MTYDEAMGLLAEALSGHRPLLTVADLDLELRTSPAASLWSTDKSVVFLRLETPYENGERALMAAPAAGDLDEILQHGTRDIEEVARDNRCTQVVIHAGREGWAKKLEPYGYEKVGVILRKVLD